MTGARLRPDRLGFHLLTLVALLVCVVAARWQWERAYRTVDDAVPDTAVVTLSDLDPRTAYSGMRVSVTGRFDPDHQILVEPRPREGVTGAWVLTPLVPGPATATDSGQGGTAVAIVRGWVPAGQAPGTPPLDQVTVVGVLVSDVRVPGALATGEPPSLPVVDTGALSELAGYSVRSGWLALQELDPPESDQPAPLSVKDLPGADVGLSWRNAAYAVQWIVFAGFVVFFWSRFRRELVERPRDQETIR